MASPPFQRLQERVFDIVTNVMGYDAVWSPYGGEASFTARVTFKDPHSDIELSGFPFTPKTQIAEWKKGDLPGLEDLFNSGMEELTVNEVIYSVIHVKGLHDGQTYQAVLERQTV